MHQERKQWEAVRFQGVFWRRRQELLMKRLGEGKGGFSPVWTPLLRPCWLMKKSPVCSQETGLSHEQYSTWQVSDSVTAPRC